MESKITSVMHEERRFEPSQMFRQQAFINSEAYERLYQESITHPENFWEKMADEHIEWFSKWQSVIEYDNETIGEKDQPYLSFFKGAKLNVTHNCLDRHLRDYKKNKAAMIWQGENQEHVRVITYQQLFDDVCRFAQVLKKNGVKKGDTVTIYMPLIPELPVAMLACARIGAIHSVVFSAFSPASLRDRIKDCGSRLIITSSAGVHGGKIIELKKKVDEAIADISDIHKVIVYQYLLNDTPMKSDRDVFWHDEMTAKDIKNFIPCEIMDSEDPLFILYTSGSTGKPKGVLHTTGGYLLYAHITTKYVFDIKDHDVYWCTADIGWVTGHTYAVYGPLSNGATVFMYEGIPVYPTVDRWWKLIEKFHVTIFYTAPTAIRSLMKFGNEYPKNYDLSSLRLLGTVGEPINPEAWMWYHENIGNKNCPIVDTWWQTETGGIMITTLPGAYASKPGSAAKPFFGVVPKILKSDGTEAAVNEGGALVITKSWPAMIRGVYGDKKNELIQKVYFSQFPHFYYTGDGARKDTDGYYWIMGRIDDVINVSGHRLATAEIESALVSHSSVAEAAVVGFTHDIKGQGIYCFVTLKSDVTPSTELESNLIAHVRSEISPIATPDVIQFTDGLPKTRSGKIMRRILRKIAEGEISHIGDTSTLADPSVVEALVKYRKKYER